MHGTASADDRRHQWLNEISIIDDARQKIIAVNSSYGGGAQAPIENNGAIPTSSCPDGSQPDANGYCGTSNPPDCTTNPSDPSCQSNNGNSIAASPPTTALQTCRDGSQPDSNGNCPSSNQTQGNASTVNNNTAIATDKTINSVIGALRPLSSDARIKVSIESAIQSLKTGYTNKALLDLNEARNQINQQLTNSTVVPSNSTLRSNMNSTFAIVLNST